MDDGDSGVKGVRGGRPPMLGSRRLTPRKPIQSQSFEGSKAAARSKASAGVNRATGRPADTGQTAPHPRGAKKRVLFVCMGNSCRSQMAEAFARAYGSDVAIVSSAGVSPAAIIEPLTRKVLSDRNIAMGDQFPKGVEMALREPFDIIVNITGVPLTIRASRLLNWRVQDPIGQEEAVYRRVAAEIEEMVIRLLVELRGRRKGD
jgi:arsenate reductase